MDKRQKEELIRLVGSGVRFDWPMDQYTTFRVGGKAEAIYEAKDMGTLQEVVAYLAREEIPYLPVGKGSNLLVKDGGLRGLVILLGESLAVVERGVTGDSTLWAGAGVTLSDLLAYCRDSGLGGLEFLAGIPGTVGGAVVMNSGAFGYEIESRVEEIHAITPKGDLSVKDRSQLQFSYRALKLDKGAVIVRVIFGLELEGEGIVGKRISGYLRRRRESQPLEYPSAGSVFRNPPNDYAGRLIEEAGLKGKRVGGAMISPKHANFIINTGGAKARDILALLSLIQETVKKETGIRLEPEIRVVGQ
jgi:UDP-N-acetylmuramate dehydrogenase